MCMNMFKKLSPQQKGVASIVIGVLILLDAMNLLSTTVHYVILVAAITIIIYGVMLTDLPGKIMGKKKS